MQRILVTGFPHTGTSILKSKIGESYNVYEQIGESTHPIQEELSNCNKDFYLWKHPLMHDFFKINGFGEKNKSEFKNDIIIIVLRNPYHTFTSLIKRGLNPFETQWHTIDDYLITAQRFYEARINNYENVYTIKYEEFFDSNFRNLKNIFDKIGLESHIHSIKDKTKKYLHSPQYTDIPDNEPIDRTNNFLYRTWQINQPFQNMNGEVNIPDELNKILSESEIIKKLGYTDPRLTH